VAVNEGGFRETVDDGVTGWMVERDARAMATAIGSIIADPSRFSARALREHALGAFTWDAAVERYLGHVMAVANS
jgi:glycosyltransferase involved in cell wall biosynthesis